jgi:transposase InsO family protein
MRADGLAGVCRRRSVRTTRRDEAATVSDDLVKRAFAATAPDRLWVADSERHEALFNRAVVKGHRSRPVAAGRGS